MSDRILGLLAIMAAGAMAAAAWGYAAPVEYEPVGPRAFPLVLSACMAACGAWLLLRPGHTASFVRGLQLQRIALCALFIMAYALLFQVLGFVVATALMALPVGRVFGGSWRQCVITGLCMGVALFIVFDRLLDVVLPAGMLKPVMTLMGW